jgi:hypothetical protein
MLQNNNSAVITIEWGVSYGNFFITLVHGGKLKYRVNLPRYCGNLLQF